MIYRIRPLAGCYQIESRSRFGFWKSTGYLFTSLVDAEVHRRHMAWRNERA